MNLNKAFVRKLLWVSLISFYSFNANFNSICQAQNSIDSLKSALNISQTDKQKFELLIDLSKKIEKSDPKKSSEYADSALRFAKSLDDKYSMAVSYINMAEVMKHRKNYNNALDNLKQAVVLGETIKSKYILKNAYEVYTGIYENQNNYQQALKYAELNRVYKDSIYSEENSKKITEIQKSYETEEKEKEIEILERDNQLKELDINQRQSERNLVVIAIVLIMISILLLYSRYRVKTKANNLLNGINTEIARTNSELSKTNKKIDDQNKELKKLKTGQKELIATRDKFFSIIAHDLRNPFNAILGFSSLLIKSYNEFDKNQKKDFILKIKRAAEETYRLLENLLEWARSQSNQIEYKPGDLSLVSVVDDVLLALSPELKIKDVNIAIDIHKSLKVFADDNMLKTILRNLISNAIKYSYEKGRITITGRGLKGVVKICVEDNGTGIDEKNLEKLFKTDEKFKAEGTANEKGTGLGLVLCKEFVGKNKGEIWAESEFGKGSRFCFSIPEKP
jgi:signal transduction histidine kinase